MATAWRNPLAALELVLAAPDRIGASLGAERSLRSLGLLLLAASALFALPYGLVLGLGAWWRVSVLYLGSTLLCLPSLHVCASFVGARLSGSQALVLALLLPAAAGAFTLGFAPIVCFLRWTMENDAAEVPWTAISRFLLCIGLAAGVIQLWRCFLAARRNADLALLALVLCLWHGIFLYVFARMFRVLAL